MQLFWWLQQLFWDMKKQHWGLRTEVNQDLNFEKHEYSLKIKIIHSLLRKSSDLYRIRVLQVWYLWLNLGFQFIYGVSASAHGDGKEWCWYVVLSESIPFKLHSAFHFTLWYIPYHKLHIVNVHIPYIRITFQLPAELSVPITSLWAINLATDSLVMSMYNSTL